MTDVKEAIEMAIQMEKDGHAFYTKAAARTGSDMGRTIFETLAKDELMHLDTFRHMFEDRVTDEQWSMLVESSKKYADIPVFPKDLTSSGAEPDVDELDALRLAMEAEQAAVEHYNKIVDGIDDDLTVKTLEEIIKQEKRHFALLQDEFMHMSSTGYWYEVGPLGQ
jgi:rubrerythrin